MLKMKIFNIAIDCFCLCFCFFGSLADSSLTATDGSHVPIKGHVPNILFQMLTFEQNKIIIIIIINQFTVMGPQATKNITTELLEKLAPMVINLTNILTYTVNYSGDLKKSCFLLVYN